MKNGKKDEMAPATAYNPVASAEAREAVGKVALLVALAFDEQVDSERKRHDLAADVERATIQAMKVAAQPLHAEVVNLRERLEIDAVLAGEHRRRLREQTEEIKRLRAELEALRARVATVLAALQDMEAHHRQAEKSLAHGGYSFERAEAYEYAADMLKEALTVGGEE